MANNQWSLDKMTKHIEQNMLSLGTGQDTKTDKSIKKFQTASAPSKLPYSADLYCSFCSLYLSAVFHKKSTMRNMKEIQPSNELLPPPHFPKIILQIFFQETAEKNPI